MKIVLDTNIWLSGLFWDGEASKLIELIEKRKFEVFVSNEVLNEIVDVLNKESKFQRFLESKEQKISDLIRTILSIGSLISVKSKLDVVKTHEADNRILELAVDSRANYLISYNRHLLDVKEFKSIKIIDPGMFLEEV